ncbi:anoctamin-4-like isoform X4 [Pecten maximus]|uniref:anoctamin-4-like isoform X4 n=1 Tax=Pecten maximus TaxID=6579 RepID=UPI001458C819|nr:anoctamin-4-like isoform X4 [Pecten maximus]
MEPIGFEMHTGQQDQPTHVSQVNVEYPMNSPAGVSPADPNEGSLYPTMDKEPSGPAPIGFEGHANGGPEDGREESTAVDIEKSPEEGEGVEEQADTSLGREDISKEEAKLLLEQQKIANEDATLFFRDGKRKIDYVLAYEPGSASEHEEKKRERRKNFEDNLRKEGLELEYEGKEKSSKASRSGKTCFVKIHAPWDVMTKYAELTNLKMPLAENDLELELESYMEYCWNMFPSVFELDEDIVKPEPNYFTAPFNRERQDQGLFVITDKNTFFTNAQRSRMVHEILVRTVFDREESDKAKHRFGVTKMINGGIYSAAFPLHDGRYSSEHSLLTRGKANDRHLLYEVWARPGAWYKYQPLDEIRSYFGEKVGIYFAWLGYYTSVLIPVAILGVVAFIYGLATFFNDEYSSQICDKSGFGNLTMCPLCDKRCSYWKLYDSCNYSRATYLFDNYATVAFALVMALWASFFQEFWKRKAAELEYEWDVADFELEEETVRPEFEAGVQHRKTNPVTKKDEPFLPAWSKCCRYSTTFTILLFFLCIVLGAVFGVILYRIVIVSILYANQEGIIKSRASFIATTTAACINLVIILILSFIYQRIALFLTNLEQHRTQTEWEDGFTFKMFLFQFVNYYSSIFYIAFFKGKFVGRPGDYNYSLLDRRQEECDPSGCLIELCIQLAVVMIGKQAFNNFKEIILPKMMVWFKSRSVKKDPNEEKVYSRWEQDFNLADMPNLGLFDEYLEMVIQYGFVTIFVAAFPLAPLFALINNIFEIRLDAYKFVTQWKRPMAARAQDIGIWFGILRGISAIAVISNGVIIAFTSEFIPKLVYRYGYSSDQSMDGYANFSLSVFNVNDYQTESTPDDPQIDIFGNVTYCRYRDFRQPPTNYVGDGGVGTGEEYTFTLVYWHILAARLAFIVVFENLIVFATWLVMYLIPDMPGSVKLQMLRENYLAKEALYTAETVVKARQGGNNDRTASNTQF